MFIEYNPSPTGAQVGDCAVRAVSKALGVDWDTAFVLLAAKGFSVKDMPNANIVIDKVLRNFGFRRGIVSDDCPDCYTAEDFASDHPEGTFVLCTGNMDHTVCVKNGDIYDSWNSSKEHPLFYWSKI